MTMAKNKEEGREEVLKKGEEEGGNIKSGMFIMVNDRGIPRFFLRRLP